MGAVNCEGGKRCREAWTIREERENQQRSGDYEKVHREPTEKEFYKEELRREKKGTDWSCLS